MSDDLKACPFCGGEMFYEWDYDTSPTYANSLCLVCGATGPTAEDMPEAAKLSDARPIEDALRAQWENMLVEIEDLTSELPEGKDSLDDVVAAVKLMCDQRDYAIEDAALCRAELAAKDAEIERHKPIPVSERMPEETEWVLIYDSLAPRWVSGMLVSLSPGRLQWSTIDGYYFHSGNSRDFSRVTHWMPLPEQPEASHDEIQSQE